MLYKNNIKIKNFGPIKEADINISPLTIFIGPNSSGKSYSALLSHLFINPFDEINLNMDLNHIPQRSFLNLIEKNPDLYKDFSSKLTDFFDSKPKFSEDSFIYPIEKFNDLINFGLGNCYRELVDNKIRYLFSNNLNKLNNLNLNPFEISYDDNLFINEKGVLTFKKSSFNSMDFIGKIGMVDDNSIVFSIYFDEKNVIIKLNYLLWKNIYDDEESISFSKLIYILVVDKILKKFTQKSYYIPASGDEVLNDINKYVSNEINGIINTSSVEKELITNLLSINEEMNKGHYYDLACELENELIGGEIIIKNNGIKDELFFRDDVNDMELELKLASSSIRELVPLILYLKYFLKKEDTLIIEEPENHLHPKNQLILVKYFVKAINDGLRIILTTHSDFIVEKFNNFIRLGNCDEKILEKFGYGHDNILNHEDVSIYNFKMLSNYSFVSEEIDVNFTGFDENNISEVISELYDESVDIIDSKIR